MKAAATLRFRHYTVDQLLVPIEAKIFSRNSFIPFFSNIRYSRWKIMIVWPQIRNMFAELLVQLKQKSLVVFMDEKIKRINYWIKFCFYILINFFFCSSMRKSHVPIYVRRQIKRRWKSIYRCKSWIYQLQCHHLALMQ